MSSEAIGLDVGRNAAALPGALHGCYRGHARQGGVPQAGTASVYYGVHECEPGGWTCFFRPRVSLRLKEIEGGNRLLILRVPTKGGGIALSGSASRE